MGEFDAYVAGFFDGEGSCGIRTYKRNGREYSHPTAKVTQNSKEVLLAIQSYYGCGNIWNKADKRAAANGWTEVWDLGFSALSARKFLVAIEPYLIVKKAKVSEILDISGRHLTRTKG